LNCNLSNINARQICISKISVVWFAYSGAQPSLQIADPGPYVQQNILFLLLPPTNFEQD